MRRLSPLAPLLGLVLGCPMGDDSLEPATYENVEATIRNGCGTSSGTCHGGDGGNAMLDLGAVLDEGRPITDALVDVPACEYDFFDRVEPGDPDRSWLYVKLTQAHTEDGLLEFTPDAAWDPGLTPDAEGNLPESTCPLTDDGAISFGYVMPRNPGAPSPLPDEDLDLIRRWILMGAPGPGE